MQHSYLADLAITMLPYCVERLKNRTYVVLNRKYKPVGFSMNNWITYEEHPITFLPCASSEELIKSLSWDQTSSNAEKIFLYADHCKPTDSDKNWSAYSNRLRHLANLKVKFVSAISRDSDCNNSLTREFEAWLLQLVDDVGPLGDLAKDVMRDSQFPAMPNSLEGIMNYFERRGTSEEAKDCLREAWEIFTSENKLLIEH